MRKRMILSLIIVSVLALACQPAPSLDKPPDIRYGEDTCDQCRMIISDPRFAASYVTQQGETRRFDDIGDMLIHHSEQGEEVAVFWVHDYETEEWVRADEAFFVASDAVTTPMDHGVVAFGDGNRAEAMAVEVQGMVMDFDDLLLLHAAGEAMPGHTHSQEMEDETHEDEH